MRYAFLFTVLSFCKVSTNAQLTNSNRQDTLRWFVGHWINNKTFKIDSTIYGKGSGGGTITKNGDGTFEVSTPESENLFKQIDVEITGIDKDEDNIRSIIKDGEGMYQYNLANKTIKELDAVKENLKNTTNFKPDPAKSSSPPPSHTPTAADKIAERCKSFEPEYHRIIDFYKAHKKDKNPHFDLPAPPVADFFNCWGCDTAREAEYDTLCDRYTRDFFKDIAKDITWLLGQIQQMEAMGLVDRSSNDNDMDPDMRQLYSPSKNHPGACSYISYSDMSLALDFYVKRGELMAAQLLRDNKTNYGALKPVMEICMSLLLQKAGIAGSDNNTGERLEIAELALPLENLYDTLTDLLFNKHDYRMIRMIPYTIGLISTIKGLEAYAEDIAGSRSPFKPKYSAQDLLGFPHFELTVELDTKIGEKGNYTIAHLKSKSKVIAELDDKECIKFTLAKKEEEKIKANIITNEAISPGPHGIYVGTKTYTSQSPVFKIRFCKIDGMPEGDSLYLSTFVPLAPDKGNWNVQGKMAPLGINQADRLFMNIEELKNDAQNIDPQVDEKQLEDIKKKALEMAAKIKAMQAGGNVDPSKMGDMVKQMMNNSNAVVETQTSQLMRIRLPLKINNLDKMLINQRFDAKEINPSIAQPIVYAYLTIKLEHTPVGGNGE